MAPDRIAEELKKINQRNNWFIGIALAILIIVVGGWARAEVRIAQNSKDMESIRTQALNKEAFFSYQNIDKLHDESIVRAMKDETVKGAIEYFNQEKQSIINVILNSQTEIVPRSVNEPSKGTDR